MKYNAIALVCLLSLTLAAPGSGAPPDGRTPLFAPASVAASHANEHAVVRSRSVRVNVEALDASVAAAGGERSELVLNLFPDTTFTAVLDRVAFETPTSFSWIGHLAGVEGSQVILVSGGGVTVGSITMPGVAYKVRYSPERVHVVEQVDPNAFPLEALPIEATPETAGDGLASIGAAAGDELTPVTATAATDDGSTFDLMVVYNAAARQAAGGTTAIQNLITLGVSETNTAYSNSGIIPRLRLVHMQEITYRESGGITTTLDRLRNPADGRMDEVHPMRNTYGADLVQFVGDSTNGGCGVAYLMNGSNNTAFESLAFSYSARVCISPNYTFGHELGHNMGSNHAPGDGTGTGAFSYSFGYKDPLARFRTVMAYDCSPSCPRVLHFSNPLVSYNGFPTGTATQDNASSINGVRSVVANFRQTVVP